MPQIDFDSANKVETTFDFPRLKLKKDERARLLLLEKVTFAWTHTLRAPKIVNGEAIKITKERKNGDKYQDYDTDFISRPLCLGDYGIITDKGVDPDNCPACAAAKKSDQVNPPERRFALNVIRYALNREGRLANPFSCACVVWAFNEKIYNRLVDIKEEYVDLRNHDLLLTCTSEGFQNFEIMPAKEAAWQLNDQIKALVQATYKENRVADLDPACGRKVAKRWMEEDLDNVARRWRIANGAGPPDGTDVVETRSLTEELGSLFGPDETQPTTTPVDLGSLLEEPAPSAETAGSTPAPAIDLTDLDLLGEGATRTVTTTAAPAAEFDFDSVLAEIDK